jgi:hypothetical protein
VSAACQSTVAGHLARLEAVPQRAVCLLHWVSVSASPTPTAPPASASPAAALPTSSFPPVLPIAGRIVAVARLPEALEGRPPIHWLAAARHRSLQTSSRCAISHSRTLVAASRHRAAVIRARRERFVRGPLCCPQCSYLRPRVDLHLNCIARGLDTRCHGLPALHPAAPTRSRSLLTAQTLHEYLQAPFSHDRHNFAPALLCRHAPAGLHYRGS